MSEFRVGQRYGKSLLGLAKEQGILEDVKADIDLFLKTCHDCKDLGVMLRSPVVDEEKKGIIIDKIFKDKVTKVTLRFFDIVISKNRGPYLITIAKSFVNQYYELKGIDVATVTTTFPLDDDLREKFKKVLKKTTGHEILLRENIDKSIIGGYIVKVRDQQLDDSVRSKIRRISQTFSN